MAPEQTLVAAAIDVPQLPSGERRGLVGLDQVRAALIARLARDQRHTHRGLGAWLLHQALHRILDADQHLAIRAVIVDALNDRAADWYAGWGCNTERTQDVGGSTALTRRTPPRLL